MLDIIRSSDTKAITKLLRARSVTVTEAEVVVRPILADIRRSGDRALLRYTKKFDGLDLRQTGFTVSPEEIRRAYREVPSGFVAAVRVAAANIRQAARLQVPRSWTRQTQPGVSVGQILRPLERVACYVPGGRFPLPSTVLMSVIPAQVAGVKEVIVTSPRPSPAVSWPLVCWALKKSTAWVARRRWPLSLSELSRYRALTRSWGRGTATLRPPRSSWPASAALTSLRGHQSWCSWACAARPDWIAADLVAQAEHDPDAVAIFITTSIKLALQVQAAARAIVARLDLPLAAQALTAQGRIVVTRDLAEAAEIVNRLAPEHLTLFDGATGLLDRVQSAGSIFLGATARWPPGIMLQGRTTFFPPAAWPGCAVV